MRVRAGFRPVRPWRFRAQLGVLASAAVLAGVVGTPQVVQAAPSPARPKVTQDASVVQQQAQAASARALAGLGDAPGRVAPGARDAARAAAPQVDTSRDQSPVPDSELTTALRTAARTKQPVEVASQTTESSVSFAQPDGRVKVETTAGPARAKVAGAWVDVDTTLQAGPGGVAPKAVPGQILFSAGGSGPMALLGNGRDTAHGGRSDTSIAVSWPGALPAPELNRASATYHDVLPHTDLVLTATRQGFTQHLVVRQRPDNATLAALRTLRLPLATKGAHVRKESGGQLQVVADSGGVLGRAAPSMVWDAQVDPHSGDPSHRAAMDADITGVGAATTLVLTPPQSFLTDPATVYPVTIDPTQTLGVLGDTFVQNNIPNTPQGGLTELRVGSYDGGGQVDRSLLRFDMGGIRNHVVQSANLALYENWSYSCSARWMDIREAGDFDPNGVTWNSQPGIAWGLDKIAANANVALGYSSACPANWVNFNLSNLVSVYSNTANGKPGVLPLAITAGSETDSYSWKKFNSSEAGWGVPTLTVAYDGWCDQYNGNRVCGAIRDKYYSVGGPNSYLGLPTTTDAGTANGTGFFNHFQGGSIYYSNATGAHIVRGGIRDKWAQLGWENSYVGYPSTDEICVPSGCYNHFERGSIYWSPSTGAHNVQGAIRARWAALGWESGRLGYPTTDETAASGGSYSHFQGGSIYWSPSTGAHNVWGGIRDRWASLGWETGYLGFPSSDEYPTSTGAQSDFAGGSISWVAKTGVLTDFTAGASMSQPVANQRSGRRIPIAVSADWTTQRINPKLQYRRGAADSWKPINLATVSDKNGTLICTANCTTAAVRTTVINGKEVFDTPGNVVYWDAGLQLDGVGGLLDVRVLFDTDTGQTAPTAPAPGVTYDPNSGQSGTSPVGPGSVNLLTGEYTLAATDASAFGVSITRSYGSRSTDAGTRDKAAGAFGPQWRMGGVAETTDAAYTQVKKTSDVSFDVIAADGSTLSYVARPDGSGAWDPERGAEKTTLVGPKASGTVSAFTLTDADSGVVSTFTQDTSVTGTPTDLWPISDVNPSSTATSGAKTRYLYRADSAGKLRLLRVAAPNPALPDATAAQCVSASVALTALPAGCRVLAPVWSDISVGSGTQARVTRIDLYATDPGTPAAAPVASALAAYTYDSAGYLITVIDPRPSVAGAYPAQPALATSYTYQPDATYPQARVLTSTGAVSTTSVTKPGRLASVTSTGRQPWTIGYGQAGPSYENGQPFADGRLLSLSRSTLEAGSTDRTNGTATTNVVYGVPLTRAAGGAQDMAATTTRWWGQDIPPTDATAVFPPDAPAAAVVGDHWASDDSTIRDWSAATVVYLDVNGRSVNTSTPVSGSTQAIDVTQYDLAGHPTFALTAGNRALVMGQDDPAVTAAGGSSATATWASLSLPATAVASDLAGAADNAPALTDARKRAQQAATLTAYEPGPVSGAERATVVQAPLHKVFTGSGPNGPADAIPGRTVTVTAYDEGRPSTAAATAVDLATTTTTGVLPGQGATYSASALVDSRTTTTAYDWTLGLQTSGVTDPGGLAITRTTSYDTLGRVVRTTMPKDVAAPASAVGTTVTSYYGPDGAGSCAADARAVVWGGMTCSTGPAGAISGAPDGSAATLPTTVSEYGRTGVVTRTVQTSGSMVRTTATGYDAADRPHQVTVTGTGPGWTTSTAAGTSMTRATVYSDAGDVVSVTDPGTGAQLATTTDTLGRVVSTTDATSLVTTTAYDALDWVVSATQSGTIAGGQRSYATTTSYDPVTGRATGGRDELAGASTASHSLEGAVVRQSWTDAAAGPLSATTLTDTAGAPTSKTWAQGSTVILSDTVAGNGHGQVVTDNQVMPTLAATVAGSSRARRYGYDTDGRLTSAADTRQAPGAGADGATAANTACSVRAWAFDLNSNRIGEAATTPTAGACAGTGYAVPATSGPGATTRTYDSADRITDVTAGVPTAYDPFGRTTATSGTTAGAPGQAKLTTLNYTVSDMAAGQTLHAGTDTTAPIEATQTWTLDPTGTRFATSTITTGTGPTATSVTRTYRYDDPKDSPALIEEGDGTITRPITDLGGQMTAAATLSPSAAPTLTWQLTNLHGDIAATVPNAPGAAPTPTTTVDEYGKQLDTPPTAPGAGATPARYTWLGAHQRSAETLTGLTLMGVRLYNPTTGRFLSVDPVPGGNDNAYTYPVDPINKLDLDGKSLRSKAWSWVKQNKWEIALTAASFVPGVGALVWGVRVARVVKAAHAYAAGVKGAEGSIEATRATAWAASRVWMRGMGKNVGPANNGAAWRQGGRDAMYGYRSAARKGKYGWSSNLTYGYRNTPQYRNFHINHKSMG